jgi:hypothetical protein
MADERTESSAARAVERFDLSGVRRDRETWDFLCECGADDCREWLTLPVAEYEVQRAAGEPILAPGHVVVREQRSRRRARSLVEEARALRGQAELQLRRAVQNLRRP